jgi:hypothetical protein
MNVSFRPVQAVVNEVVKAGVVFTVIVIVLEAVGTVEQKRLEVITTRTESLFARVAFV